MFGWFKRKPAGGKKPGDPDQAAPEECETFTCSASTHLTQSNARDFLLQCGVTRWNQERRTPHIFWPDFSNFDFVSEARKGSRIWGVPVNSTGAERVVLADADLEHADLRGCSLGSTVELSKDRDLSHPGADLSNANLTSAVLCDAKLWRVTFEGADLRDADLRRAHLRDANFAHANLVNANLLDADLHNANLSWADLTGAIVSEKALRTANLFGAKMANVAVPGFQPKGLLFGRNLMSLSGRVRWNRVGFGASTVG